MNDFMIEECKMNLQLLLKELINQLIAVTIYWICINNNDCLIFKLESESRFQQRELIK